MARQRDRKAEEARRNARAQALGFKNRAAMRRAIERGEFLPARKGRNIVGRAQGPTRPKYAAAGFTTPEEYKDMRRKAAEWSKRHSHVPQSRFLSKFNEKQTRAYYDAFLNDETKSSRIENGYEALRHWLVDMEHYYTTAEFDERYNVALS